MEKVPQMLRSHPPHVRTGDNISHVSHAVSCQEHTPHHGGQRAQPRMAHYGDTQHYGGQRAPPQVNARFYDLQSRPMQESTAPMRSASSTMRLSASSTLSTTQKVRARVSPLIELRDPNIFEVILTGNNMLPLVKRRSEFVQFSQELHGMNIGTPALRMHQQDPCLAAQDIQQFLDAVLATIGIEDDSAPCRLLKSFMGLWAPQSAEAQHFTKVDDFRANAEGTVDRNRNETPSQRTEKSAKKSPRSALQPVQPNLSIKQQPSEKQYQPSPQATLDQKAASDSNLQGRELPITSLPQMPSAEDKAFFFRKMMLEAEEVKSTPPNVHNTIEIQDFSANAYFASMKQNIENGYEKENTSVERHAPSVKKLVGVTGGRAERQVHMLIAQTDTNSTLKTWISCTDEEAGLTFTQSLCGDTVFDIALPKASTETVSTPRNKDAISLAPAPIESSSTTSSRVAALAGYTSSFRDIRSKFANAVGSISDQEYASSLLASLDAQQQAQDDQQAVKPNREVFEHLVNILKVEEEVKLSDLDPRTARIRAGIVLCSLCLASSHNRNMAVEVGAIDVLSTSLAQAVADDDARMKAVICACLSNIGADRKHKELIIQSPAIQSLEQVLSCSDMDAAAQAAGTLWGLCVDNTPEVKSTLATQGTIRALIKLLLVEVAEVQARATGCLSEICIKNAVVKTRIANSGAFLGLSKFVGNSGSTFVDIVLQRLAAVALCNLVANHPANKRLAKRLSLIGDLASLLKHSEVVETQNAAASCIFNLVCKTDKEELEALEILPTLRSIKSTARMIDTRLLCATNNPNEVNSPAFGTF